MGSQAYHQLSLMKENVKTIFCHATCINMQDKIINIFPSIIFLIGNTSQVMNIY